MRNELFGLFALLLTVATLGGCTESYVTPGRAADFSQLGLTPDAAAALTDSSVRQALAKKPMVVFPATIAIARVQAGDYDSYSYHRYRAPAQTGAYSVITVRDVEKEEDIESIGKLPKVDGIATMKRILLDKTLNNDEQLRAAAAKLHTNLLLYYTFDTAFTTDERVRPLSVITLGIFPNQMAKVTCTASAVLMDVNNGYIYTVVESTAKNDQLANAWSSEQAMDDARKIAERKAFEGLLASFIKEWPNVLKTYDRSGTATFPR